MSIYTSIGEWEVPENRFFAYARERHEIYLRRKSGAPAPWTEDPILRKYRFTNVFRELDRTTLWFAKYVREPHTKHVGELLLATVLFRWFNRIETGETLFCQPNLMTKKSLFEEFVEALDLKGPAKAVNLLRSALLKQGPPWTTGAYIINTAGVGTGKTKLDGVLAQFQLFIKRDWQKHAEQMEAFKHSMEDFCRWLGESPGMGPFMCYEVACDLRWTPLLNRARDIDSWANPGPGARRGSARIRNMGSTTKGKPAADSVEGSMEIMRDLLIKSRSSIAYWPEETEDWPRWEMREVEHTLCEWDKYERARLGQGRPRGTFP